MAWCRGVVEEQAIIWTFSNTNPGARPTKDILTEFRIQLDLSLL